MDGSTTHHDRPPTSIPIPHSSRRYSLLAASPNLSVPLSDIRSPDSNPPDQNLFKLLARSKDELVSLISSNEVCALRIREVWDLVSSHEHTSSSSAAQIQEWKQSVFAAVSEEAITEQLQKATVTEQRKLAYQTRVNAARGIFPGRVLPKYTPPDGGWSRDAWRGLAELAELVKDPAEGQRRLEQQVMTRLSTGGKRSSGWRGHSWLGHQDILQVLCEEQHLQQEPRYAEEHGDRENFNVRKRRKNKKDNFSAVTNMSAKRKAKNNSGKTSAAADNIGIDPYGEERIKGSRHNSVDEKKQAKEFKAGPNNVEHTEEFPVDQDTNTSNNDADITESFEEPSNADYDNSETKNQIEMLHERAECQIKQKNTMLSIGPEPNEPSKKSEYNGTDNSIDCNFNILMKSPRIHSTSSDRAGAERSNDNAAGRSNLLTYAETIRQSKTKFLKRQRSPSVSPSRPALSISRNLTPLSTMSCCNIQDRTIDHYNSLPSSKASRTLLSMLEKFATEYAGPFPDAWEYRTPLFSRQAAITIAQSQLEMAQSDQIGYNAIFATIAQLTSAQKPNTDSLREWAVKNSCALQTAKVESRRLEDSYRVYDVGLKAISVVEGAVRESKREMEGYIREMEEKVEPLIKKYSALEREMQEIRRGILESGSTPENQAIVPLVENYDINAQH